LMVQSLLADQGRLLALFRTTPMLNSPKNQAHLLTRDGSTTIAVESLLLNPGNYSRLDPLSEKHPKPGFSFVGTMKSIGIDYYPHDKSCATPQPVYYRR
jgi:hypothetical protein